MKWQKLSHFLATTDRFYTVPLIFSAGVFFLLHLIYFLFINLLPSKLPLYYSLPWGENQLVYKHQFLILPLVVLLVSVLNTTLAWRLNKDQILLRRMLFLTVAAIDFLLFIAGLKIITIYI